MTGSKAFHPEHDQVALSHFVGCMVRLARDERLKEVFGLVIGSGFNSADENVHSAGKPTSALWYARVFNGFGTDTANTDNVVQQVRAVNPTVRVLVGPLTPWSTFQSGGTSEFPSAAPWLAYMDAMVGALGESARERAAAGIASAGRDGFAVQAPGRVDRPELRDRPGLEPLTDVPVPEWNGAQAGFRVYQDWLRIINSYPGSVGLPVYITSTNTFMWGDGVPPAQNYPRGWLSSAARQIGGEPQIQALIWFLDDATDPPWEFFSLSLRRGYMADAETDFENALKGGG
jgi:hypothetical protein